VLETTIAGSLPKPVWLAKPRMLWAPWQLEGEALVEAKRDATMLALKEQEDAGIDIVTTVSRRDSISCTAFWSTSRVSISPAE
jgi:methionine synthase II (cobalamin-independent)